VPSVIRLNTHENASGFFKPTSTCSGNSARRTSIRCPGDVVLLASSANASLRCSLSRARLATRSSNVASSHEILCVRFTDASVTSKPDRDEPRSPPGRTRWRRSGRRAPETPRERGWVRPGRPGRRHRLSTPTSSCRCQPSRAGWRASRRAGRPPPRCHCRTTPSGPRCSRLTGVEALARTIRTRSRV
jgi:hypothetical protein